jgi:hypothetical protein
VLESVRTSFDTATAAIGRRCDPVIGKRQVEDLVVACAVDIDAFYEAQVPTPCTAKTLLVISADGKGIVMRPEALRPAAHSLDQQVDPTHVEFEQWTRSACGAWCHRGLRSGRKTPCSESTRDNVGPLDLPSWALAPVSRLKARAHAWTASPPPSR